MIAIQLVPGEAHFHGAPAIHVLAVKLAVVAIEATHDWRLQPATRAAHPVDRPLALCELECAQRETCPPLGRKKELVHCGHAFEIWRHAQGGRKLLPLGAPNA